MDFTDCHAVGWVQCLAAGGEYGGDSSDNGSGHGADRDNCAGDDYDTGELLVTAEDLVPFLEAVQKARAAESINKEFALDPPLQEYILGEDLHGVRGTSFEMWADHFCGYIGDMEDLIENMIYHTAVQKLEIHPLSSADGQLTANVTYYGAVGAGCSASELAYQFLRLFLTEKAQWQECTDLIAEPIDRAVFGTDYHRT